MRLHPSIALALLVAATPLAAQEPNFGRAVVATTSEIVVGQPVNWYGPGTVYAFRAAANGQWREQQRLIASDSSRMDDFGRALALDGNTLIVGAPRKRDGAGVAYAFTRASATAPWRQSAIIEAPMAGQFGTAMVLAGDDLLIGAPAAEGGGVVHHFRRAGDSWRLLADHRPAGATAGFGAALALDGDRLLIGAPATDSARGAVHHATRQANGSWSTPAPISLPAALMNDRGRMGTAVLLADGRAWITAPGSAQAIELERRGEIWAPIGLLQPHDGGRNGNFGAAIARVGEEIWIGAPSSNDGNGHVYRFIPAAAGGYDASVRFTADSADGTHWPFAFGYAIAGAGNTAVVSMPSRDFGEGRVLVASRQGNEWTTRQLLTGEIHVLGGGAAPTERCAEGKVGVFTCNNVEVIAHLPTSALGGERGAWVNDVWGWTDPANQRDYALVARRDGISFVDVTDPAAPRVVGDLPRTEGSPPSVWRDIKVIDNHAYIVADGSAAHGVQVFDLTRLRAVRGAPRRFAPDTTYREIHSAHNIVADTAAKFLYVVGANSGGVTCGGGLHMVDARQPKQLSFAGCYTSPAPTNNSGYTHDAQCLVYRGPDARYRGRQICVGSNASEINIADVTDKANPVLLGRNSYPNVAYAHQGWFDDEQRYFYMNDEIDELNGNIEGTRTIVWDLAQLDDPVVANMYIGPVMASDHNLYVVGDRVYESNYGSGLRVLDISDRVNPREIAFFDSAPMNDDGPGHSSSQSGAWSNYPFFKSGVVVFTSVREGLFIVRVNPEPVP